MYNKYRPQDFTPRLDSSICLYKKLPYYLRVNGDHFILTKLSAFGTDRRNLDKLKDMIIQTDDPDLDISTIPLGYFFLNKNYAAYVERIPIRKYKQPVSVTNCRINALTSKGWIRVDPENLYSQEMEDSVLNKFHSFNEACKLLKANAVQSIPLHRDIALVSRSGIYVVYYKNEEVGWITPGTRVVKVPADDVSHTSWVVSMYLQELDWIVE